MEAGVTVVTAGVDVGSAVVKVAVTRSVAGEVGQVLGVATQRIRRRVPAEVAAAVFRDALGEAGVGRTEVAYVATTGEAEGLADRDGHFYSMTTHAYGGRFLCPEAEGVLDAGALHARAIRVDGRGKVLAHRMTSQCASGSGQFLEDIARYLGVPLEDVGPLSCTASRAEPVSSICAVLAETDVINMVSRGVPTPEIIKGIHLSIAVRLLNLARSAGLQGTLALTGGLSRDDGLLAALREVAFASSRSDQGARVGPLVTTPLAAHAGALGAALLGARRLARLRGRAGPDVAQGAGARDPAK
jgi:benzoyl-CoA reductase subunit D